MSLAFTILEALEEVEREIMVPASQGAQILIRDAYNKLKAEYDATYESGIWIWKGFRKAMERALSDFNFR